MADIKDNGRRCVIIKNFRNLGVNNNGSNYLETLIINRSLKREDLGGIVSVIGPNNSGKSNVLDALETAERSPNDCDCTDFSFERIKPEVAIINQLQGKTISSCKGQLYSGEATAVFTNLLLERETFKQFCEMQNVPPETEAKQLKAYVDYIVPVVDNLVNNRYAGPSLNQKIITLVTCVMNSSRQESQSLNAVMDRLEARDLSAIRSLGTISVRSYGTPIEYSELAEIIDDSQSAVIQPVLSKYTPVSDSKETREFFKDALGYEPRGAPDDINPLFKTVIAACGFSENAISNAYEDNGLKIGTLEKRVNSRLSELNSKLNHLLKAGDNSYRFEIRLERQRMVLNLYRGNDVALNIDRQSAGFRWLLEFFIEVIIGQNLEFGDIVLIDEFGNSLNWGSVKELTETLRTIGKDNGITFVLATQNPMAIDIDYLDEVRLIEPTENGPAIIHNNFIDFSDKNHDVLKPIIDGLTIGRNYMRTDGRSTVFVEGATDYFYLNGFRRLLETRGKHYDIDFIPINGVSKKGEDAPRIIKELRAIERHTVVLVDGDGAGKTFQNVGDAKGATVVSLSEIFNGKKKVIEDLFEDEDLRCLNLEKSNDNTGEHLFDRAATFAQGIMERQDYISKLTEDNFDKVFEYLSII